MSLSSEYTTPFEGRPYYSKTGVIKAVDHNDAKYAVGEITYERFDDQNFQYIFSPYWDEISLLPTNVFHGIPGINLDIKKEHYYRVNMTPSFIEMRTPGPSREDLWDLLDEVDLDYYDRFEWLLRTNKRCGDDNLIVERKRQPKKFDGISNEIDLDNLQCGDKIVINKLSELCTNDADILKSMYRLLSGPAAIQLKSEKREINLEERKSMIFLLKELIEYKGTCISIQQRTGIDRAKKAGKYLGRKRSEIDPLLLKDAIAKFREGKIDESTALKRLGISRSTFYRRMREEL